MRKTKSMGKIVLVADKNTVACFKLAGLGDAHSVGSAGEAEKQVLELLENPDLTAILVTERIVNQIPVVMEKATERKYPVIVPIPDVKGKTALKTDLLIDLIRRKTGIEVKLR